MLLERDNSFCPTLVVGLASRMVEDLEQRGFGWDKKTSAQIPRYPSITSIEFEAYYAKYLFKSSLINLSKTREQVYQEFLTTFRVFRHG